MNPNDPEIRVNKINSRTGVGTITLSPTGVDFTGIATVATLQLQVLLQHSVYDWHCWYHIIKWYIFNLHLLGNDKILVGTGDDYRFIMM